MIQELLKVEQVADIQTPLSVLVPSLSKPRPTSFLTGQEEVARSSEQDPSAWQLEIPSHSDALTCMQLCQFMDTYQSEECLLDLKLLVGLNRSQMSSFARGDSKLCSASGIAIADCHRPIVESLLECGKDISHVKGFFTSNGLSRPDQRREILVVERQNKLLCIFRGTPSEQRGKVGKQLHTHELKAGPSAKVFAHPYAAFAECQSFTFQLLDELSEDNPFSDIVFTGHVFGATMATIAAYLYANTRTALRVSCMISAPSKAGPTDFRWAVHSTPNLNICRLELGKQLSVLHVGHCLRLTPAASNRAVAAQLLKFGGFNNERERVRSVTGRLAKPKEKSVHEYVSVLEALEEKTWVKDYYYQKGGEGAREASEVSRIA